MEFLSSEFPQEDTVVNGDLKTLALGGLAETGSNDCPVATGTHPAGSPQKKQSHLGPVLQGSRQCQVARWLPYKSGVGPLRRMEQVLGPLQAP